LISSDGLSLIQAMLTRNQILEHEDGRLYLWQFKGKLFLEAQIFGRLTKRSLKEWVLILNLLEEELSQKDHSEIYCMAQGLRSFRFCQLMGFQSANEHIAPPNMEPVELMRKVIHNG